MIIFNFVAKHLVFTLAQASIQHRVKFFPIHAQLTQFPRFDQRKWSGLSSNTKRWRRSCMLYLNAIVS